MGSRPPTCGVQFSVTGPASLSSSTVNTDSNGRAQVSVQAGATTGAVTVTATVGSFTPDLQSDGFAGDAAGPHSHGQQLL